MDSIAMDFPRVDRLLRDRFTIDANSGCWNWHGTIDKDGYGKIKIRSIRNASLYAHRVSYELYCEPIPDGLQIDHLCRNRRCANPEHLEPVTCKVNIERSDRAQKKECKRGHPFTTKNTYFARQGKYVMRSCRQCQRIYTRNYNLRKEQRLGA